MSATITQSSPRETVEDSSPKDTQTINVMVTPKPDPTSFEKVYTDSPASKEALQQSIIREQDLRAALDSQTKKTPELIAQVHIETADNTSEVAALKQTVAKDQEAVTDALADLKETADATHAKVSKKTKLTQSKDL